MCCFATYILRTSCAFVQEAIKQQRQRRESQVTLYRKYRIGDLPDIQINYSYLIAPLQALAHVSIMYNGFEWEER
jgi:hypothetical protein